MHTASPEPLNRLLDNYLEDAVARAPPLLSIPAQYLLEAKHTHNKDLDPKILLKPSRVKRVVGATRAYTGPLAPGESGMPSSGVFRWSPHGDSEFTWHRYDYQDILPLSEARAMFFVLKTRDPEFRQCYVLHLAAGFLHFGRRLLAFQIWSGF